MIILEKGRISKEDMYLNMAETAALRSTCLKRKYGCVIVKNDRVISTGYNGSPSGSPNCCDIGYCPRAFSHKGERYDLCKAVHAEMNALLNAGRDNALNADLYLVGLNMDNSIYPSNPCPICEKLIAQSKINNVYIRTGNNPGDIKILKGTL